MRLPTPLTLTLTLLPTTALANPNTPTDPLSIQMANSIISRSQGIYTPALGTSGPLQAGFVQKAFTQLLTQYPTHPSAAALTSYQTQSADSLLPLFANTSSALHYSMDRLSAGNHFLALATRTSDPRYLRAAAVLKASVDENQRNAHQGLWYFVYPNWSYLDGMFSLGPFWAAWTGAFDGGNGSAWGELGRQFGLLEEGCAFSPREGSGVPEGLLVHGYDDSRTAVWANNSLGQSPHVWGRSLGWYVMGLLDTLSVIDASAAVNSSAAQSVRESFADEFQVRMQAVARSVDPETGAWWQLLDQPGRERNYIESSGSAMFVYALLAGVRKGYLTSQPSDGNASFVDIGKRAYAYLKDTFVVDNGNGTLGWNGTVGVCSLNSTASYEYYTGRPIEFNSVLGSAAFVLASVEAERLEEC